MFSPNHPLLTSVVGTGGITNKKEAYSINPGFLFPKFIYGV